MSRATKFAGRDPGPSARMSGFLAHLRANGLRLGVTETQTALEGMACLEDIRPAEAKRALKAVLTGCRDEYDRFDELFDSYWLNGGRVRTRAAPTLSKRVSDHVHSSRNAPGETESGAGRSTEAGGIGEAERDGEGKLIATEVRNLMRRDLRDLVRPEDIAEAQRVAERLGAALRDQRSRRRKAASKGDSLHFRKVIRQSLSTGGEPLRLPMKRRPDRTRNIVALCDVSGSMSVYAKVFLAFLAGLMRADPKTDAYLFHTRLVRITEALNDRDAMRAMGRMSLMADGFGGGSKIGLCLDRFARSYAKRFVNGRSIVLILSDGYDTGTAEKLADALQRLRKRGCRIIWLNPLKGWRDYAPVAQGMAAALPFLDLFAAANTLSDLADLEREVTRL